MEHFRAVNLNLSKWFRSRNRLKDFLFLTMATILFSGASHLCNFGSVHYEEHSCEINSNLDQWFRRRCCLKKTFTCDASRSLTNALIKCHRLSEKTRPFITCAN